MKKSGNCLIVQSSLTSHNAVSMRVRKKGQEAIQMKIKGIPMYFVLRNNQGGVDPNKGKSIHLQSEVESESRFMEVVPLTA
ncbi:hypothetical protein Tco_0624637 [Tanacetum coccineum]|uniref:Uncharacterized protein n=1 Tax=Tanacetum coccineum TaxID=301880 RepID=A0ABQ4WEI6_9ASTR